VISYTPVLNRLNSTNLSSESSSWNLKVAAVDELEVDTSILFEGDAETFT
jgi:hypothetical protein